MRNLKITPKITVKDSDVTSKYFNEVGLLPLLTIEEEVELSKNIQDGDKEALNKLVEGNLRFVISVAKQYQNLGEPLNDLICSGNEGLIKAAKRFDHTRGIKFISYGVCWIRHSILKHLSDNIKIIRLPGHKLTILNQIKKLTQILEQNLNRLPTNDEIKELFIETSIQKGKLINIKESEIELLTKSDNRVFSLDKPLTEGGDISFKDFLSSEGESKEVDSKEIQDTVTNVFNKKLTLVVIYLLIQDKSLFS